MNSARLTRPFFVRLSQFCKLSRLGTFFLSYRILAENPVGKIGVRESVWIMRRSREMCPGPLLLSGMTGPFMLISYMVSLSLWFLYMASLYSFSIWSLYMVFLYGFSVWFLYMVVSL